MEKKQHKDICTGMILVDLRFLKPDTPSMRER